MYLTLKQLHKRRANAVKRHFVQPTYYETSRVIPRRMDPQRGRTIPIFSFAAQDLCADPGQVNGSIEW